MPARARHLALASLALAMACGGSEAVAPGGESSTGAEPEQCAPISIATVPGPGAQRLERIATRDRIPGLAAQPTAHGSILGTVFAFDGRLHLGYGDYDDNTGPIPMTVWDPELDAFAELGTLPTEEVLWFRPGLGALFTPAIDPDGHEEAGGIYRLDCGAESWHVAPPIPGAVHVYDVAVQGDLVYASTGSLTAAPAQLMASSDRGESWEEVLRHESPPGRFSRIYFVGATPQLLFASGRELPDPSVGFAWLRRGEGEFEALVDPPGGSLVPIVLGDQLVVVAFSGNPGRGSYVASYRIEGPAFVEDQPWPQVAGELASLVAWAPDPGDDAGPERLLVLMAAADGSYRVQRSADLGLGAAGWEELATLEALDGEVYVSMARLLGDLYLGTNLGSLYVVRELEAPAR